MFRRFFQGWKALAREQKLLVSILCVGGLAVLTLGVTQMRRTIIYPFTAPVEKLQEIENLFGPTDEEKIAEEKRMDSDGDGLSDWDEANVYKTSAYLVDTDSDGEADNIEIAKGTDPNCPKGDVCFTPVSSGSSLSEGSQTSDSGSSDASDAFSFAPNRDPDEIRQFLLANGMSEIDLAGYSDEMLLDAYDRSSANPESSSSTSSLETQTSVENL